MVLQFMIVHDTQYHRARGGMTTINSSGTILHVRIYVLKKRAIMLEEISHFNGIKKSGRACSYRHLTMFRALVITVCCSASSSVLANEFWANPLGGGSEDVAVKQVFPSGYQSRSNVDWIEPSYDTAGNLLYEVKADSDATVVFTDLNLDAVAIPTEALSREMQTRSEITYSEIPGSILHTDDSSQLELSSGNWTITAPAQQSENASASRIANNAPPPSVRVDLENSPYSLAFSKDEKSTLKGMQVTVSAWVTDNTGPIGEDDFISGREYHLENAKISAKINFANGTSLLRTLKDNGKSGSGDVLRGDDIFSLKFHFKSPGMHYIDLVADGEIDGKPFRRQTNVYVLVGSNRLTNISRKINATQGDILGIPLEDGRFGLPVNVKVKKGSISRYC